MSPLNQTHLNKLLGLSQSRREKEALKNDRKVHNQEVQELIRELSQDMDE